MKKYHLFILGCQMNYSDAERIATVLEKSGYEKTLDVNKANLIIAVACSVRQSAIDRIYGKNRIWQDIKKKNTNLKLILTGCVSEKDKIKLKNKFDLIFDIKELNKLSEFLKNDEKKICDYLKISPTRSSKFQALVPIMTGCNNFCSYCIVPYVRGREISRPAKDIINEIKNLIEKNYKEITLLGQNVNSYKHNKTDFPKLLKKIDAISGNYWLRFMTSHPKDLSDDLIKVMKNNQHLCPYLHLPIQSGDDEILKKMNRNYNIAQYKKLIKKIREAVPKISISTDVIVGFPNETKAQFNNTKKLFREIKFDMAYTAQYSPRPGTVATKLDDNISKSEKRQRENQLLKILKKNSFDYNKKMIGLKQEMLVEKFDKKFNFGRTKNFKPVKFQSNKNFTGQFVKIKITKATTWNLEGKLCEN